MLGRGVESGRVALMFKDGYIFWEGGVDSGTFAYSFGKRDTF